MKIATLYNFQEYVGPYYLMFSLLPIEIPVWRRNSFDAAAKGEGEKGGGPDLLRTRVKSIYSILSHPRVAVGGRDLAEHRFLRDG